MIGGRVLDASTLVGFALVRPYPQALVWTAVTEGMVLAIPAAALATAWADTPPEAQDALSVLLGLPNTIVDALDAEEAQRIGRLLGRATAPLHSGIRAAQVVSCGLRRGWPVVSGEADGLRGLDPRVEVDELP